MTPGRHAVTSLVATAALAVAGCGPGTGLDSQTVTPATEPTHTSGNASTAQSPATTSQPLKGSDMKIDITIGDQRFRATLDGSEASRDLISQLPLTLQMGDHGAVEKTGPLPSPLSLAGQPAGADPEVGDVGYYAPGHDFVLYYGDQSYYRGIVVLGRMDDGAAQRIAEMQGSVIATIAPATD